MITSSGRSLWLRFKSDGNIEYRGFKVVYSFIENPLGNLPDMGKCAFEGGGFQEFVGSSNITDVRRQHSLRYDVPVDCVWTIKVEESFKLYIQFMDYDLEHPNDCHLNFIQVRLTAGTRNALTSCQPTSRSTIPKLTRTIWSRHSAGRPPTLSPARVTSSLSASMLKRQGSSPSSYVLSRRSGPSPRVKAVTRRLGDLAMSLLIMSSR